MKKILFYLFVLFCSHYAVAQNENFSFPSQIKKAYPDASRIEELLKASTEKFEEIKIRRQPHLLDKLIDRHFHFVSADKESNLDITFCKNEKSAKKYAKGVYQKNDEVIVIGGIVIAVRANDTDKAKRLLQYFSKK